MKVKSKLMEALASLKDQAKVGRAATASLNILSDIEIAVIRSTDHHDTPIDDKYIHEILFHVSNAPGSITFLARTISTRIETARDPLVSLKTLVLIHRLLRGGDRYFEQDLRNLFSSCDLRMDPRWLSGNTNPLCRFIIEYSKFLEERMGWIINQAGKLEPVTPSSFEFQSYEEKAVELVLYRLLKCQTFLDRIMGCFPISNSRSSHVDQLAISIIIRESFRVYDSFREGIEIVVNSFVDFTKPARVSALDILKKACTQTPDLHELYEDCKRSIVGKSLDYPSVHIITTADISSVEQLSLTKYNSIASSTTSGDTKLTGMTSNEEDTCLEAESESCQASSSRFARRLETKISTVWVEFDDEDSQTPSFSFGVNDGRFVGVADDLIAEGESSRAGGAMNLL